MGPDKDLQENGLLLVTGSTPRAEEADRPLAYGLQSEITGRDHDIAGWQYRYNYIGSK